MSSSWNENAQEILRQLQSKVADRDLAGLLGLFEDPAVLIGTAGAGRTPAARHEYLTAVATQPGVLTWEWDETSLFYEADDVLGFAAFGDVVLTGEVEEFRAPIRGTFLAVRAESGWRIRHFHGSIPQADG